MPELLVCEPLVTGRSDTVQSAMQSGNDAGTVLVIDDEESMRDSCEQILTRRGYSVMHASTGEQGLTYVRECHPDLVVLDFKLQDMPAEEIMSEISSIDSTIVIAVITGYATIESAVEAIKCGASEFLPKPFTPEELRMLVKRGMDKRGLLVETQRLSEENQRIRENFVSVITHEMRSPLVSVEQYLDVILDGYAGELTEKQENLLTKCRHRIRWLLTLVTEWLDMSRIQTALILERIEPLDISTVLSESYDMVRGEAEKRSISARFAVPDDLPHIEGDRELLTHLFMNLYSNAVKYNRECGSIASTVETAEDIVIVTVRDTGVGIPEENLPFIFDEFFRVRSIREKVKKGQGCIGTGLGLAITKKIVDAHKGYITVESELDRGTAFIIHLPIHQSRENGCAGGKGAGHE